MQPFLHVHLEKKGFFEILLPVDVGLGGHGNGAAADEWRGSGSRIVGLVFEAVLALIFGILLVCESAGPPGINGRYGLLREALGGLQDSALLSSICSSSCKPS